MVADKLVSGIRSYMEKNGFKQAHLGLSGGIDSALAAYLAAEAAGRENITCLYLPSRFSSGLSGEHAALVAARLGCRFETLPIEAIFIAFLAALEGIFKEKPFDIAEENIQSRIRGTILMAYSNKFSSMLLSCANKSELATGYCTLYGDTVGGLLPLGDLFKTEVYETCKQINERESRAGNTEIFPQAIIDKPPSAELRPNQKDEDTLPPYDVLDSILKLHLCEGLCAEEIAARGNDFELAARIIRMAERAEFKRRQMPPVLKLNEEEKL